LAQGAPAAVLLVGDATCDYLGVARNGVRCWMPSFSYTAAGETFASDYWMTTVAGGDDLGDYMLGRLSVANAQDAQTVVDKIVAYDQNPKPGPWRARMGYIADQGEFGDVVDGIRRDQAPDAYSARRVLLDECALEDNWYLAKQKVERQGDEGQQPGHAPDPGRLPRRRQLPVLLRPWLAQHLVHRTHVVRRRFAQ